MNTPTPPPVHYINGRPRTGRTTRAVETAIRAAVDGVPSLFIYDSTDTSTRMVNSLARVAVQQIGDPADRAVTLGVWADKQAAIGHLTAWAAQHPDGQPVVVIDAPLRLDLVTALLANVPGHAVVHVVTTSEAGAR